MLVERASKATRQRGPPPQGSTASHKRYVVGGDTPSTSRHRHPQNPGGRARPREARRGCYTHTGAAFAVVAPCPLPGFWHLGAGKEGLALEPAPPGAGRPTPPLVPDKYELRAGVGAAGSGPPRGTPPHPFYRSGGEPDVALVSDF